MTRLYCPVTADGVAALATSAVTVEAAFAVTDDVRALAPDGDEELHEHLACQLAAAAATSDPVAVLAFDVRPERVEDAEGHVGAISLLGDVGLRDVACFLVADPGERVQEDAELELSWYDAGERDSVRALLSS